MKRFFLFHAAPVAILAMLSPSPGHAQTAAATSSPASADDNTRVRVLFRKGVAAFGDGKNEEAERMLREAWSIRQTYDVAAALAQAELAQKHYRDAAEHLDFCLSHFAPVESEQTLQQIRTAFADVKTHVAALQIATDRDGAEVQIDGRPVGKAPLQAPAFVDPGTHAIAASLNGDNVTQSVQTDAGKEYPLALRLGAASTAQPAELGVQASSAPPTDSTNSSRSVVPVIVGGALFVAGATAAIGFGVAASSKSADASSLRGRVGSSGCSDGTASASDCSALRGALDAKDRDRNWSTAGIVLAGVAVVATSAYWFLWPRSTSSTSEGNSAALGLRATASPTGANVWISGLF